MKEKRGRGRPELPVDIKMVTYNFRMTPAQRNKIDILGGAKWMRTKIDQAKVK